MRRNPKSVVLALAKLKLAWEDLAGARESVRTKSADVRFAEVALAGRLLPAFRKAQQCQAAVRRDLQLAPNNGHAALLFRRGKLGGLESTNSRSWPGKRFGARQN